MGKEDPGFNYSEVSTMWRRRANAEKAGSRGMVSPMSKLLEKLADASYSLEKQGFFISGYGRGRGFVQKRDGVHIFSTDEEAIEFFKTQYGPEFLVAKAYIFLRKSGYLT